MNHIESILNPGIAWCNELLMPIDFYFKSVDSTILTVFIPESKTPCSKCLETCIKYLQTLREKDE